MPGLICRWPSGGLQAGAKWRPLVWTHRAAVRSTQWRCWCRVGWYEGGESGRKGAKKGVADLVVVAVAGWHASLVSALFPFPWKTNTGQPACPARPSPWGESANLLATRCRAISAGETEMRSTVEVSVLASCSVFVCLSVLLRVCICLGWLGDLWRACCWSTPLGREVEGSDTLEPAAVPVKQPQRPWGACARSLLCASKSRSFPPRSGGRRGRR